MTAKTFDWSAIPNIEVRGKRRACHVRIEKEGKTIMRTTGIEADPAGKNAEFVREWLRAFRLQLVKDTDKLLALTRTRDECATFAELFAAYRQACVGRDIAATTVDRNVLDLTLIIRTVHGKNFSVDAARQRFAKTADSEPVRAPIEKAKRCDSSSQSIAS